MSFRITGLPASPFSHLFGLPDAELAGFDAARYTVDETPGFPDRIELRDGVPGETVILVNYEHLPARTPYRSRHAVFVLEGATQSYDRVDEVPNALRGRVLSLRGFDDRDMIVDADLVDGADVERLIERLFADARIRYIHAHYAKRGCYACRIGRE
ncbi:DUF1203 domain-containing protein [Acidiphilium sp. AL]|uniref:DUF1203 domain-containing protein n=1 Tax=Acidiphilium iwatense TaxID=768198 RepID=A0ABS9DQR7_9PROT|nr:MULTISPECIES: DUF1203 domain-containing protein [Acidiphilium]MCF3945098.1 DUF1203 domain-containing protein [Acidiphilium iwatense]MCU4160557.1 DUF1203 domain-containing protein [Acidiphilium sp. AL]